MTVKLKQVGNSRSLAVPSDIFTPILNLLQLVIVQKMVQLNIISKE